MKDINGHELTKGEFVLYLSGDTQYLAVMIDADEHDTPRFKSVKFGWNSTFSLYCQPTYITDEEAMLFIMANS